MAVRREKEIIPLDVIRKRVEMNVKAYHNVLHDNFIKSCTLKLLLAWTHPLDRPDFEREIEKTLKAKENGN